MSLTRVCPNLCGLGQRTARDLKIYPSYIAEDRLGYDEGDNAVTTFGLLKLLL